VKIEGSGIVTGDSARANEDLKIRCKQGGYSKKLLSTGSEIMDLVSKFSLELILKALFDIFLLNPFSFLFFFFLYYDHRT